MEKYIRVQENGIYMVLAAGEDHPLQLLHLSTLPPAEDLQSEDPLLCKTVEIAVCGRGYMEHHGMKHIMSGTGHVLRFEDSRDYRNESGRKLELVQTDGDLKVISHFQFYDGIPVLRSWTEAVNRGPEPVGLEAVSSFCLTLPGDREGESWDRDYQVSIGHNSWYGEAQWRTTSLAEAGLSKVNHFTVKPILCNSVGSWSSSRYLPMGGLQRGDHALAWQIEHNGSWSWEIGDNGYRPYLLLSGPSEDRSHWYRELKAGERFESVPAAVSFSDRGFQGAIGELTRYRRRIRRDNEDNRKLPVIFNDYMNCLMGDPTTEKLIPLIDAAAKAGCEYFCIDAGWYADGYWWDGVGQWIPSEKRFPGGIEEPIRYIRSRGMVPGLWLEIEVIGINCPLAQTMPDSFFFLRHGKRVSDHGRYQLDFRNPEVRKFADGIVDRLVTQYGVGYLKMDYNIDAGIGTEYESDSFGDGLLEHNRAYLQWLDSLFERYPELVIENCGSGGMRMDYAMLSRLSIQSSSDQTDYLKNAVIAGAAPTAVTPEQCAVWSYPLRDADREQTAMNMIGSMLLRIHQSGHLAEISPEGFRLVQEGISVYKNRLRKDIPQSVPFWPLGLPHFEDDWTALGLSCGDHAYLAVWRFGGDKTAELPLDRALHGAELLYPAGAAEGHRVDPEKNALEVTLEQPRCARLYRLF